MTQVALPVGFWSVSDPRASGRATTNCFAEMAATATSQLSSPFDSKQKIPPAYLRRAPGTDAFANDNSGTQCRGMWNMQGVEYAVIGPTLYSVSSAGVLTSIGTGIPGNGFVRMSDNTACLSILVPGTTTLYTYCPNGGGFSQLTAPGFTQFGAIDMWFCDTFMCFVALNGRDLFNDDGQAASGQGQITFNTAAVLPRELGTDLFIGMAVDHREVVCFGAETTEGYLNVGNAVGSPFSSAPGTFMQIGMHPQGGYTAVLQDQTLFWLANDLTIRRRSGQTPLRVSNHGVEFLLSTANLTGCYAFAYTLGGHLMYVLTMPAQQLTIAYDVTTQEWHKMTSLIGGHWSYWRPLCSHNAFGKQLVGDSQSGQIGVLDFATFTEFGSIMMAEWTTQSVYSEHNRISHRRVECVVTPGESGSIGSGSFLTNYISDDSGRTFRALPMRSLGMQGNYKSRAVWFNCGTSRDRVYKFRISDPSPLFTVDITADLEGGRW